MPAIPSSATITTHKFVDEVFDFLALPNNALAIPEFGAEDPVSRETARSAPKKTLGVEYTITMEVLEYERPYAIGYRLTTTGASRHGEAPPQDFIFRLRSVPQGTQIKYTQRLNGSLLLLPLSALLWPLGVWGARRYVRKLRDRMEEEAT